MCIRDRCESAPSNILASSVISFPYHFLAGFSRLVQTELANKLVRATRPMPRTQPLRGRRRRHRRRRRRRRTLVLILTPCSPCSSTCTCSSRRSFSFCRCTPIWAMRGGSGCAASAWGAPPLGDHGCVAWVGVAKARNLGLPDPLSRSLVLVCALPRCLRINITVHQVLHNLLLLLYQA